jgi:hypothetical protein
MTCRIALYKALCLALVVTLQSTPLHAAPRPDGQLEIAVVDSQTGQPIAARMHLRNTRRRPVELNLPNIAEFAGHFYIDGRLVLPLRRGQYAFELDAGPEYLNQTGHFEIDRHADDTKRIEMKRFANLAEEGWWAGDLDVDRNPRDLPLIFRAEQLQDIEMPGFARLIMDAPRQSKFREEFTRSGRKSEIKIARIPYAWNMPIWLAREELDAIQLIHGHALRDGVADNEDDGRPRDRSLYPGRSGNSRWSETVYYHVLDCGLRIPPAAGSGSGANENPVGTNRVYVHCGEEFSAESWWEGLQAGRVFVTNGPLLRPKVEGRPPGHVFHLTLGDTLTLEIGLDLATRVPIDYLQIVQNGKVEAEVRLADWKNRKGRLPPVTFQESGWFLVRAVTNNQQTYQFASSGPYYVEQAGRPRVSRRSVHYFLDWLEAAKGRAKETQAQDLATRRSPLAEHESARHFFIRLLSQANAD